MRILCLASINARLLTSRDSHLGSARAATEARVIAVCLTLGAAGASAIRRAGGATGLVAAGATARRHLRNAPISRGVAAHASCAEAVAAVKEHVHAVLLAADPATL